VSVSTAPVAPSGCPSAIAPPCGFTFSGSMPSFAKSRMQASACGAKASLSSTWSTASPSTPAFFRAFFTAGTGPQPMICGSQAASPTPARRASGFAPCFVASFSLPITIAAAPSTTALALAAVIVPPSSNAGPSRDIFASDTSSRMWVSLVTATGSLAPSRCTMTGSISSPNQPASRAAFAFVCERSAKRSASSRVMP